MEIRTDRLQNNEKKITNDVLRFFFHDTLMLNLLSKLLSVYIEEFFILLRWLDGHCTLTDTKTSERLDKLPGDEKAFGATLKRMRTGLMLLIVKQRGNEGVKDTEYILN